MGKLEIVLGLLMILTLWTIPLIIIADQINGLTKRVNEEVSHLKSQMENERVVSESHLFRVEQTVSTLKSDKYTGVDREIERLEQLVKDEGSLKTEWLKTRLQKEHDEKMEVLNGLDED